MLRENKMGRIKAGNSGRLRPSRFWFVKTATIPPYIIHNLNSFTIFFSTSCNNQSWTHLSWNQDSRKLTVLQFNWDLTCWINNMSVCMTQPFELFDTLKIKIQLILCRRVNFLQQCCIQDFLPELVVCLLINLSF